VFQQHLLEGGSARETDSSRGREHHQHAPVAARGIETLDQSVKIIRAQANERRLSGRRFPRPVTEKEEDAQWNSDSQEEKRASRHSIRLHFQSS